MEPEEDDMFGWSDAPRPVRIAVIAVAFMTVVSACGPERLYTYRIATRGPVVTDVDEFAAQAQRTLEDPRGWTLGGSIEFRRTTGPADFTLWLSTAGNVPSFSSACSSMWSCRVGPDVIINEDRWRGASATWPFGVVPYRSYVVNHEVGHWLGFGHLGCAGPGAPAPVMAQQSKGGAALGACRFNTWPTGGELDAAAARHGVTRRPTGLPSPDDPFGNLDVVTVTDDEDDRSRRVRLRGWAIDGDTTAPLPVVVAVNGVARHLVAADRARPDVRDAYERYGARHGFDVTIDLDRDDFVVCVDALGVQSGAPHSLLGCEVVK